MVVHKPHCILPTLLLALLFASPARAEIRCNGFLSLLGYIHAHHRTAFDQHQMLAFYQKGLQYAVEHLNDAQSEIDPDKLRLLTTPKVERSAFLRCHDSRAIAAFMTNYTPKQVTPGVVMELQLKGMLQSMDPHSDYYTPFDWYQMVVHSQSAKAGFAVAEIGGMATVGHVYPEGAADGLLAPGDIVLGVRNGASGKYISLQHVTRPKLWSALQGEVGSELEIVVDRAGAKLTIPITLQEENGSLVTQAHLAEPGVGYLQLANFDVGAAEAFLQAVRDLSQQGARSLIVDLRNNPGGNVDEAVKILDGLLDVGVAVSFADQANNLIDQEMNEAGVQTDMPIALLTNRYSASAAELLAAAVADYERGYAVGEVTFGKGTAQMVLSPQMLRELTQDDSIDGALRLTVYQYYTPSGQSPQLVGVTPYWEEVDSVVEAQIAEQIRNLGAEWDRMQRAGYKLLRSESDFPNALLSKTLDHALFQGNTWPTNKMHRILDLFGTSLRAGATYSVDPILDRAIEINRSYFNHCIGYHMDQCNFADPT